MATFPSAATEAEPDLGTPPVVPLHPEFMRDHVMIDPAGRVTGLFDFEPAMRGAAEYDFVAVGLFVSSGDGDLLRRFLRGYGRTIDPRRCLACALLHVHSNFRWYFEVMPAPPAPTLDAVATAWGGQGNARRSSSARCTGVRPDSWAICVRQLNPSDTTTVSSDAARIAGSIRSSATAFDTS
jgi:hypothetical protein